MTIRLVKYYQLLGKTMVYQRGKRAGGGGDILSVESVNQRDREEGREREREKGRMRQREHRAKRAQSRQ